MVCFAKYFGGNGDDSMAIRKVERYILFLIFAFMVSRLWAWSVGVHFDDYRHPAQNAVHIMQMYPTEAMEENTWETIWYNHSQPPLYSILMWATNMNGDLIHLMWMLLGLVSGLTLYSILIGFSIPKGISLLLTCLWMLCPSTILFENVVIYEYWVATCLIFAAWALQRKHLITFSVLCCTIVMTRSLFHPVLFLLPVLILGWTTRRER